MKSSNQSGFTLVEALVAIVVLVFGLIAVSNLMLVATSSTSAANQGTGAAAEGSRMMETLMATNWPLLVPGGDVNVDVGAPGAHCDGLIPAGVYNCEANVQNTTGIPSGVPGVGPVHVRWEIKVAIPGAVRTLYIRVQAEGTAPLAAGRSRATFSMFRGCTAPPIPDGPCPVPPVGGGL
jgi:type II secretory pathway pseudopilin PulG